MFVALGLDPGVLLLCNPLNHWPFRQQTAKKCIVGTLSPFTAYNKDKVHVDVAAFLVVNHVNIGVLCLFMFMFMVKIQIWKIHKHLKGF